MTELKMIKTLNARKLNAAENHGGCGECQASCQSACKTSCTVGNQSCESPEIGKYTGFKVENGVFSV